MLGDEAGLLWGCACSMLPLQELEGSAVETALILTSAAASRCLGMGLLT